MPRSAVALSLGFVVVGGLLTLVPAGVPLAAHAERPQGAPAASPAVLRGGGRDRRNKPLGGDLDPETTVWDPYPTFNGVAVDPVNNRVLLSDLNRHGILLYDRSGAGSGNDATMPLRHIMGPATEMVFVAGVQLDPERREMYVADNDAWGVRVFGYDDQGNVAPRRVLATPHQAWGLSLSRQRHELAVSVEELNAIVVYHQDAKELEPPIRVIRGDTSRMADPHGIAFDEGHHELIVANHGNWTTYQPNSNADELQPVIPESAGHFEKPSINVYAADANGDPAPLRVIQGDKTGLNWPMQLDYDPRHDEIFVANFGGDAISVFRRGDSGDVRPVRTIAGAMTGLVGPVGVAVDAENDEIWVANYGDHTALAFPRGAQGDVAPTRVIRNAPRGAATCGFTDASAAAYDSTRKQVLVANCVSVPRIAAFNRLASGAIAPLRAIQGQATKLSRTIHGLDYDKVHDELVAPVYEGGAVLVFRGGATGEEAPIRAIQGKQTKLLGPQTAAFDTVNDEIVVGDPSSGSVLVYPRTATGDVAPRRILRGDKTKLRDVVGVAIDTARNLLVVSNRGLTKDTTGIFVFGRTDEGDVAPRSIIAGSETGIGRSRQVVVDSERGKIYLGVQATNYHAARPYQNTMPRPGYQWSERKDDSSTNRNIPSWTGDARGFVGVWDIADNGNVAPRAVIKGSLSRIIDCGGIAIEPSEGLIISADGGRSNMYHVFLVPQFFTKDFWERKAQAIVDGGAR